MEACCSPGGRVADGISRCLAASQSAARVDIIVYNLTVSSGDALFETFQRVESKKHWMTETKEKYLTL